MRLLPVILILSALNLTACAVTVQDVPKPVKLPKHFSASGKAELPVKWWTAFKDSELNRFCELALSGNYSLRSAYSRLKQSEAIAVKSGAELIPQVNVTSQALKSSDSQLFADDFSLGLAASYELDLWGRIRSAINASRLDVNVSEADYQTAALTITAEIASTWFQLIEQRQQLALLDSQIKINENFIELLKVRYLGAQAVAADIFQQQQLLESVIGNRHAALSNIAVLQNRLAVLSGVSPKLIYLPVKDNFPSISALPDTGLTFELLQHRPDIRKAYFSVQAADQRIASAIADRFPKLSLTASVNGNSPQLQSLLNNWLATIGGNLVLPVIDGRRRVAEIKRTQAVADEALNNYAQALLNAVEEIENALIQEQQQHQIVDNLERQVELARLSSTMIRNRYINGVQDFLRVLSAFLSQQSLERSLLQSRLQLLQYRVNLYRAMAGSLPITSVQKQISG
jgi:NodT family efflux transporter outer membrane factor (OMF) lipoprotein